MLPYLNLFRLAIPVPAITILIGISVGLSLAERFAPRYKINPDLLYNLVFNALIGGIIGARLFYVLLYPQAFIESPASLISLNFGLFDLWGGIFSAIMVGIVYGQRKQFDLLLTLDALTPAFAVFSAALGIANLASGKAYGVPTDLPWAVPLWNGMRHPTQAYHAILAFLILWMLWPTRHEKTIPGSLFLHLVGLSSLAVLFIEAFRDNSIATISTLRDVQLAAWLVLAGALWGISRLGAENQNTTPNP